MITTTWKLYVLRTWFNCTKKPYTDKWSKIELNKIPGLEGMWSWFIHLSEGHIPIWCSKPLSAVNSKNKRRSTASIATLPFQVSALFVQPHSHTITGGGNSLRCESYAANNSSTLPNGTRDWQRDKLSIRSHTRCKYITTK